MNLIDHQELKKYMEISLLEYGSWRRASDLSRAFLISERQLRGDDSPIKGFAISSNDGYMHILNATDEEWNKYYNRIRSHAISELRRVQYLKKKRVSERQLQMEGV